MKTATFFSFLLTTFFFVGPLPAAAQSYDCTAQSEVPVSECEALVALYNATDGDNWTNNSGWFDPNAPISQWEGVTVQNGNVTELNFRDNNLSGMIPPEIGQLSNLTFINLVANQLSGPIPQEIIELDHLTHLYLSINPLGGIIPPKLGQLTSLVELSLHTNQFDGAIPSELGQLSNLTYLNVSNNQLSRAVPSEIGQLSNLQRLDLSRNQLSGTIPVSFTNLSNLRTFAFYDTDLCMPREGGFPTWIGNVNDVQGTDVACGNFSCALHRDAEVSEAECEALVAFYYTTDGDNWRLNNGWLYDPIRQWHGVTVEENGVTQLGFSNNHISGAFPPEIGQLENLSYLYFIDSQLGGTLPPEIGQLENLESLRLENTEITGPIPSEIGQLSNLRHLSIRNTEITGSIPPEIGQLENLKILDLGGTKISGTIPVEIEQLQNLKSLQLGGNQISGAIPSEIGQLTNLKNLLLSYTQISGAIPPEIGQLINLEYLDLPVNQLSGAIPPEIGQLANLKYLNLSLNQLGGAIPPEIRQLTNLEHLYLSENQLSGALPAEIGQLTKLIALVIRDTQLGGPIPFSFTNLSFDIFHFQHTNLCTPQSDIFQTWLNTIPSLLETQITCTITEPVHGITGVGLTPTLDWQDIAGAEDYDLQLSDNANDFNAGKTQTILIDETGLQESAFTVPAGVLNVDTAYFWRVRSVSGGEAGAWEQASFTTSPTGTGVESQNMPATYALAQNYPNPFNPETTIRYEIAAAEHVRLEIFDMLGRRIQTLVDRTHDAGHYEIRWNGRNAAGQPVASGLYLYRLRAGSFTDSHTMHLIK